MSKANIIIIIIEYQGRYWITNDSEEENLEARGKVKVNLSLCFFKLSTTP
jgi:hypothetical protein